MSMRERLIEILVGPGAMCVMSREDAEVTVDALLEALSVPDDAMMARISNLKTWAGSPMNVVDACGIWGLMMLAAKES